MQSKVSKWNDEMYRKHATNYSGLAGISERIRVRTIRSLADIRLIDTVLEVGCEAGNLMARLPKCRRLVGVDVSGAALRDARQRFSVMNRTAKFFQCDATEALPFEKGAFSVIICSQMLEHVSEPAMVIDNILRVSEASTRIVLSVNDEEPNLRIKRLLVRLNLMQILLPTIETGTSEWHLQKFSKSLFLRLLSEKLLIVKLKYFYGIFIIASCKVGGGETSHL